MAAGDVGKQFMYHSEGGNVPCWVVEYHAGRPAGDHLIAGFTNSKQKATGEADTFSHWRVYGDETGAFS